MNLITDELTRDERFVFDILEVASPRFRKFKTERIGLLVFALANFEGWSRHRIDSAIEGLKKKARIVNACGIRKVKPGTKVETPSPSLILRRQRIAKWKNCVYCNCGLNETNFTLDHVLPKSRGGSNHESNLVGCCKRCNEIKANRTPCEWCYDIMRFRDRREASEPGWIVRYALRCSILLGLLLGR